MKVLEEDVERSLQLEESRLDADDQSYPDDVQGVAQELKTKHNVSKSPITVRHSTDSGIFSSSRSNNYENA